MVSYNEELKLANGIIKMELIEHMEADDKLSIQKFSDKHTLFKGLLSYDKGKQNKDKQDLSFSYQCNLGCCEPDLISVLANLLLDISAYEYCSDEAEFLVNWGYTESLESLRTGMRVYRDCQQITQNLRKMFSESEFAEILDIIEKVA